MSVPTLPRGTDARARQVWPRRPAGPSGVSTSERRLLLPRQVELSPQQAQRGRTAAARIAARSPSKCPSVTRLLPGPATATNTVPTAALVLGIRPGDPGGGQPRSRWPEPRPYARRHLSATRASTRPGPGQQVGVDPEHRRLDGAWRSWPRPPPRTTTEAPGTPVRAALTSPPVSDSRRPRSRRVWARTARGSRTATRATVGRHGRLRTSAPSTALAAASSLPARLGCRRRPPARRSARQARWPAPRAGRRSVRAGPRSRPS